MQYRPLTMASSSAFKEPKRRIQFPLDKVRNAMSVSGRTRMPAADECEGTLSATVSPPEVDGYSRAGNGSIDGVQSAAMMLKPNGRNRIAPQSHCDVSDAALRSCFKLQGGHVCDEVERNENQP